MDASEQFIHFAASILGAALAGFGMLPFYKRHFRWTHKRIEKIEERQDWAESAIDRLAEWAGARLPPKPSKRMTPPPTLTPSWEEITNSGVKPKPEKK